MEKEPIEKDTYERAKNFLLRSAWTQGEKDSCSFKDKKEELLYSACPRRKFRSKADRQLFSF